MWPSILFEVGVCVSATCMQSRYFVDKCFEHFTCPVDMDTSGTNVSEDHSNEVHIN